MTAGRIHTAVGDQSRSWRAPPMVEEADSGSWSPDPAAPPPCFSPTTRQSGADGGAETGSDGDEIDLTGDPAEPRAARLTDTHDSRANATKIPSPRKNPGKFPTDPGRRGKEGSKGRIKKEPNVQVLCRKNLDFFSDDWQTPARREARNHRSEDAKILGPPPSGPQCTGRADQRDARGDANRDRSTQNHHRPVLLCATQRPGSTNNETTTTTRHRKLRDPRPTHLTVDLGDWGLR